MTDGTYTHTARALHWVVAALVLGLLVVGTFMTRVSFDLTTTVMLYQAHKSLGLSVFVLMCVRLAWRGRHAPPSLPADVVAWRCRAASIVHGLIYVWLFALPITGWLSASAAPIPFPFMLFGLIEVPPLAALADLPYDTRSLAFEKIALTHRRLAWGLGALIALHIAGALWPARHRHIVLARMWPKGPR